MLFRTWRWFRRVGDAADRGLDVVLFTRSGCHLCEDALLLLRKYQSDYRLIIQERDIDAVPDLAARYGERVPVVLIQGRERFFGKVNEVLLRRLLQAEARKLA